MGLGTIGGFRLQVEDRGNLGFEELERVTQVTQNMAQYEDVLSGGSFATGTATAGLK